MVGEDYDIDSLAAYLHLTPAQVRRLADRDRLPGRKVGGQWRFAQADIHHWMEQRMGLLDETELTQVENVLRRSGATESAGAVTIAELLSPESIAIPLPSRTRPSVISSMVELAMSSGMLWDPDRMGEAVQAREDLYPTALDNGVALLHPRRPMPGILGEPIIALGRTSQGIPFGGSRGVLTDIFFLICSIDDQGHLFTLARLSRLISDGELLAGLRQAIDSKDAHDLIRSREEEMFS